MNVKITQIKLKKNSFDLIKLKSLMVKIVKNEYNEQIKRKLLR